jgi:hypothetical protein
MNMKKLGWDDFPFFNPLIAYILGVTNCMFVNNIRIGTFPQALTILIHHM